MSGLKVLRVGPIASIQDQGRPGLMDQGVSQGGAVDVLALAEGAALLRQSRNCAALEMGSIGGTFQAIGSVRIALTGAPMNAVIDGSALVWNASYRLEAGQKLEIGAAQRGVYGYLHIGGGIDSPSLLGARATHLAAGLGRAIKVGEILAAGPDEGTDTGLILDISDRFQGGDIRITESFQSSLFTDEVRLRFGETDFHRGARANRMGVEVISEGEGLSAANQLNILSEVITPGDVQMTGDGKPFVLLRECQTTGGYPRIGTVLPCDLPKVAQTPVGAKLRFRWVTLDEGLIAQSRFEAEIKALPRACRHLVRDPHDINDLLAYQLVGGVVSAASDPFDTKE
ncbi:MAG: 5-oxoprolinase subunit C family protein [Paracoccaceae bacterium]